MLLSLSWGLGLNRHGSRLRGYILASALVASFTPGCKIHLRQAFYMRLDEDGRTVSAMDILVPKIGEIIGGSQREERLERIEERIRAIGQKPEDFWWYLDLRRYGRYDVLGPVERPLSYFTHYPLHVSQRAACRIWPRLRAADSVCDGR